MAMFGAMPAMGAAMPGAMEQMAGMMPKRAGMFGAGKGNIGDIIQSVIGGYMAGRGLPGGGALMGMANHRREAAAGQEQAQQDRESQFQDFVRREAYKAANPGPVNNDTVADYNFITQQLGPDEGKNYLRNRANPPRLQFIQGIGLVDVSQMGGGQAGPPAGVTFTPIDEGGPTPQASGGFPRPY